jgi:hypothetical protein
MPYLCLGLIQPTGHDVSASKRAIFERVNMPSSGYNVLIQISAIEEYITVSFITWLC